MPPGLPSIPQAIAQAYRDLGQVLRSLPSLAAVAFLVILAVDLIQAAFLSDQHPRPSRTLLFMFLLQSARAFLLTPFFLAVHRLIILNETAHSYVLTPREPRFQRFFGWLLAIEVVMFIPLFLVPLLPFSSGARMSATLLFAVAIVIALLRLTIVFPALAVDAPGANFENALADTKGRLWWIFFVSLLVFLPPYVPAVVLARLVGSDGTPGLTSLGIVNAIVGAALGLLTSTLLLAVASRLYGWIGQRTKEA